MAFYQQVQIQRAAEGAIHERLVPTTTKHQTKEMAKLFRILTQELIDYAIKRPQKYNLKKLVKEAEDQWKQVLEKLGTSIPTKGFTSPKPEQRPKIITTSQSITPSGSRSSRVDLNDIAVLNNINKYSEGTGTNSLSSDEDIVQANSKRQIGSTRKMSIVDYE